MEVKDCHFCSVIIYCGDGLCVRRRGVEHGESWNGEKGVCWHYIHVLLLLRHVSVLRLGCFSFLRRYSNQLAVGLLLSLTPVQAWTRVEHGSWVWIFDALLFSSIFLQAVAFSILPHFFT